MVWALLGSGRIEGLLLAMGAPFIWIVATLAISVLYWLATGASSRIILRQFRWRAWIFPGLGRACLALTLVLAGAALLAATEGGFSALMRVRVANLAVLLLVIQTLVWFSFLWRSFGRQASESRRRTWLSALVAAAVLLPFDIIYGYLSVFAAFLTWGFFQWVSKGT